MRRRRVKLINYKGGSGRIFWKKLKIKNDSQKLKNVKNWENGENGKIEIRPFGMLSEPPGSWKKYFEELRPRSIGW